jgi:lipopolysaccharide biosynthesis protein
MKWLRRAFKWLTSDVVPGALSRVGIGRFRYKVRQSLGVRRPITSDFSLAVPFGYQVPSATEPRVIGIVCHLFHDDLAEWMFQVLSQMGQPADVYFSTDAQDKVDTIRRVFSQWKNGSVTVRLVENRGRDIAPKLITFADVYARYELLLFLHSKKSPHYDFGEAWRDHLVQTLAGSPAVVASVIEIFNTCPAVGMVIPQHFNKLRAVTDMDWGANFRKARRLAWRMDIDLSEHGYVDMPSGSMFWARPKALKPLLDIGLGMRDFPPEPCHWDGTIAHCIERLFLFSCEKAGFTWLKVTTEYPADTKVAYIEEAGQIETFASQHRFDLLDAAGKHR